MPLIPHIIDRGTKTLHDLIWKLQNLEAVAGNNTTVHTDHRGLILVDPEATSQGSIITLVEIPQHEEQLKEVQWKRDIILFVMETHHWRDVGPALQDEVVAICNAIMVRERELMETGNYLPDDARHEAKREWLHTFLCT